MSSSVSTAQMCEYEGVPSAYGSCSLASATAGGSSPFLCVPANSASSSARTSDSAERSCVRDEAPAVHHLEHGGGGGDEHRRLAGHVRALRVGGHGAGCRGECLKC
jgi:hypothetical protein